MPSRFGMELNRPSPRQSDPMIVGRARFAQDGSGHSPPL